MPMLSCCVISHDVVEAFRRGQAGRLPNIAQVVLSLASFWALRGFRQNFQACVGSWTPKIVVAGMTRRVSLDS